MQPGANKFPVGCVLRTNNGAWNAPYRVFVGRALPAGKCLDMKKLSYSKSLPYFRSIGRKPVPAQAKACGYLGHFDFMRLIN
jgi:hypothetical protein